MLSADYNVKDLSSLELTVPLLGGKVHGSLARAGSSRSQDSVSGDFHSDASGRCVAQTLAVQARCAARRRRSPSRTRRSTRPAVPSAAFSTTADSSMSLLAPARRRARTATMSHKFSCRATHRSSKDGRWVSLASCYLLARFVSPFRASNVLHSFDAQMMVKNSFLEIVVISTLSLMRRAWIMDDHGSSLSLAIAQLATFPVCH